MRAPDNILVLDSNASDLELATQLLRTAYPAAQITPVDDPVALATALTRAPADVAIIAPDLKWAGFDKVMALFAREAPDTAIVLFGDKAALNKRTLDPGRAINGLVRKTSAGYVKLATVVSEALPAARPDHALKLDNLPAAAAFISEHGAISATNAAFPVTLGRSPEQLAEISLATLCASAEQRDRWLDYVSAPHGVLELGLKTGSGEPISARLQHDPLRPADYRFVLVLGAAAGPEINIVAAGRDNGSREMHDIALVFSHDLKEPVQQIMRLVRRLEDGERTSEPGFSKRVHEQLHTCAERASAMLDGMLEYLAISARDEHPKHVDLNDCLEEALDNLRAAIDESHAQIVSARLPIVTGDGYQLLHLFQNLLGNAIKFRTQVPPRVNIEVSDDRRYWAISFTDNGIGIAPDHCEQVFDMGKRLHTRDEYPGGGIGLTLCRRIVERHGGSIHIEPADSGGCRIVVKLPHHHERMAQPA